MEDCPCGRRLRVMKQRWTVSRGTILFLGGLAGVVHETVWQEADRPTLLLLFAAMMGLPAFLSGQDGGSKGGGPP